MAIKLVVADDHQIVRRGLRALFAADRGIKVIGEASSGREAIRITARLRPDVLLLDLQMEELGGLEALRVLKDRAPQTRVVIFTMHYSCVLAAQALENGAMGYVLKGCPDSDLIKAVRGAVEGKVFLSGPVKDVALRAYMAEAETGGFDPHDTLTARQTGSAADVGGRFDEHADWEAATDQLPDRRESPGDADAQARPAQSYRSGAARD